MGTPTDPDVVPEMTFSLSGRGKRAADAELGGYAGGAARTRNDVFLVRQGEKGRGC